jgi:gliding motility-associated-like protein
MEDQVDVFIYDIVIPEGFSPNNDPGGYNNTFIIKGLDLPNQIAELSIINGAGTEVYSTSNRDGDEWIDWDGKNMKGIDLAEGTYYYLLSITSKENGQLFKKSGFIVLKRY